MPWQLLFSWFKALSSSPCWNFDVLLFNFACCQEIWLNLPLVSGIMLLCSASFYMPMLTLGSHRLDCSVLGLTLFMFMMKFEFSCQSLELISRIAQPVCLKTSRRMQLSFTQPTADIFYSSFSFIVYQFLLLSLHKITTSGCGIRPIIH